MNGYVGLSLPKNRILESAGLRGHLMTLKMASADLVVGLAAPIAEI
jgi:hypothetical protein